MAVDRCVVGEREDGFHFWRKHGGWRSSKCWQHMGLMADYPPLLASSVFDSLKCNVPQI